MFRFGCMMYTNSPNIFAELDTRDKCMYNLHVTDKYMYFRDCQDDKILELWTAPIY